MVGVRMTQTMMSNQAMTGMQTGLNRLAKVQEQLRPAGSSTGRPTTRPAATSAMRMRTSVADQKQFVRNGEDALGWLNQIDASLADVNDQVRRARELAHPGRSAAPWGRRPARRSRPRSTRSGPA